jgi:hypothetical protein
MTVEDFSKRVANYLDEDQIEEKSYFLTALNGVILEIAERFPLVASVPYTKEQANSETTVNMNELVNDFASFSTPAFRADEVSLYGRPLVDARMGEIMFPVNSEGRYTIYYHKKIPSVTLDTEDVPFEGERLELLILGVAYRLLTIDADYNAAATVKRLYDEYAARLDERRGAGFKVNDVTGW